MTKAAVFDLDGVLLDSMGIWNDLGARYLRSLGVTPEEGLNEILFSMSMEQGAEYLHTHYALPQSAAEVGAGIADMLRDFYFYEVPAKDGAAALLAALTARGVKLAAATSSPREHVTRALERLGLLGYFTRLFTTAEVGVSKHEPTIYLLAAEALHAAPAETLVFEDSLYALKTAKAAGFYTIGVYQILRCQVFSCHCFRSHSHLKTIFSHRKPQFGPESQFCALPRCQISISR